MSYDQLHTVKLEVASTGARFMTTGPFTFGLTASSSRSKDEALGDLQALIDRLQAALDVEAAK